MTRCAPPGELCSQMPPDPLKRQSGARRRGFRAPRTTPSPAQRPPPRNVWGTCPLRVQAGAATCCFPEHLPGQVPCYPPPPPRPQGTPLLNQQHLPWRHQAEARAGLPPQVLRSQTQRRSFLLLQGKKLQRDRSSQKAQHTNPQGPGPPCKQRPQEQLGTAEGRRGLHRASEEQRAEGCLCPNGQGGTALAPAPRKRGDETQSPVAGLPPSCLAARSAKSVSPAQRDTVPPELWDVRPPGPVSPDRSPA